MAGSSEAMVTDLREMRHIITNLTEVLFSWMTSVVRVVVFRKLSGA